MNESNKLNKSGYIDGNKHKYASFEKDLLATKSITRLSDNLKIEIDPYDKIIYMVMRDSFYGYKNAGLKYYEDQTDIAAKAGVSASKLKKSIKKWESIGLIMVKPIRTARGNKSNSYVVTSFSYVSEQYQLDATQMVEKEPSPGDATPNLKQQSQELLAKTTGNKQFQQVGESTESIPSHDDAPLFGDSPSDYQNVPPHYYKEDEEFWRSAPIASSKPAPKYSAAALLDDIYGGNEAAPASRTPTTSSADYYDCDEPF